MTFHVCCHDCQLESVWNTEECASNVVDVHADRTGHDVEFAEVD